MKRLTKNQKLGFQLALGCFLAISGLVLLFLSFFVPPTGIIHSSVLAAVGEVFTFSGALIGIDYSYKLKFTRLKYEEDTDNNIVGSDS